MYRSMSDEWNGGIHLMMSIPDQRLCVRPGWGRDQLKDKSRLCSLFSHGFITAQQSISRQVSCTLREVSIIKIV